MITIITILLALALVIGLVAIYNRLVTLRNRFKNAFSQISVQLQRRHDLIPNFVEIAKAYMRHERETLEAVIAARNIASAALRTAAQNPADAGAISSLHRAEAGLGGWLSRLMAVSEAYPTLRASETMAQLSSELVSAENKIGFARQAYNDSVMDYNTKREAFPTVLFAGLLGFNTAELFQLENAEARAAPRISFS